MKSMTSKERMLAAMNNRKADMVPVAPDMSNMIPCRLTGRPYWDIYLYNDIPKWKAYIDAVRHFGFDGWLDTVCMITDDDAAPSGESITHRTDERIYTRTYEVVEGRRVWAPNYNVYYKDNPPTHNLPPEKICMPAGDPVSWTDVERRNVLPWREEYRIAREYMGDSGVCGLWVWLPGLSLADNSVFEYYDDPAAAEARCEREHQAIMRRLNAALEQKPDFILIGISGFMLANPEPVFRQLSLKTLKAVTAACKKAGVTSQIHCCGPSYQLVRIAAEESDLCGINPLEIPPMGDCTLKQVKRDFGSKLSLMGNLHTTDIMLRGTEQEVADAAKMAMDDAAEGGGFILSTGDQCGRDTPDGNIRSLIDTARSYGKY